MILGKKIAIVVPAYNEAKLICRAVSAIPSCADEIIIVDDASTDRTREVVELLGRTRSISFIRHEVNLGVGAAIVTGYKAALEKSADIAAVMAGDAQMDPDDLPALAAPVIRGEAEYAKGDRLSWPGAKKAMPFVRFAGNHILSRLTRLTSGYTDVRDSQCGYTAISAEALDRINLDSLYPRYGFPNDILAKLHTVGARVADVPVRPVYADEVSGISWYTALVRVPLVLFRSMIWRIKTERRASRLPSGGIEATSLNTTDA